MMTPPNSAKVVFSTKWFRLVEAPTQGDSGPYYFVEAPDCVTVLALTSDGKVPLIRQYRPVLDRFSLELPSGHVDQADASYETAARRELLEETGYQAKELHLLGAVDKDVGRLKVQVWGYFAAGAVKAGAPHADEQEKIELILAEKDQVLEWARDGKMLHAQDLAVILLARLKGYI